MIKCSLILVYYLVFQQISVHMILCLIASVLSLHLMFLFLGREADSRKMDKAKCQSNFMGSREFTRVSLSLYFNPLSLPLINN